jgi:hypothetical protein
MEASVEASDGPGAWSPLLLPGLALWLDGTNGLSQEPGGKLTWLDRSGHANSAVSVGTPSIDPAAIGGKPAVHLNGSTDYFVIQDSPSLQFGTDDFAIAVVAEHTTPGTGQWGYGLLYTKQIPTVPYPGQCIAANSVDRSAALFTQVANQSQSWIQTTATDFNTGRPFFVVVRRIAGTTLSLRVNGSYGASATGPGYALDVSASGYPLRIGGTDKQQDVLGDIAEVVAMQGSLSALDLANLEGYLAAKYGL